MLWKVLHLYWANVILAACFTLRGHDCSYCFLVGRICPLMQAHFLWPLLKRKAFLLRLNNRNKGSNFLQSAFWISITKRFSLVRECNVFLQYCIMLGPVRQFSLENVKLSRIVTYRSNIIKVNCSLNWSYINLLWRIELWLSKLQLSVFLKIVWVFWLERVVPPLVIALNKLNSLWTVLLLPQFVIRQDHGFGSPHEPHQLPGWLCA